jgi:hypothetical protein
VSESDEAESVESEEASLDELLGDGDRDLRW